MENLKKIFEGNQSAYGQLILSGETTEKGKALVKHLLNVKQYRINYGKIT